MYGTNQVVTNVLASSGFSIDTSADAANEPVPTAQKSRP